MAVPDGSTPLIFRKPVVDGDGFGVADGEGGRKSNRGRAGEENGDDFVLYLKEGTLIMFPPWLDYGVPLVAR